MDEVSHNHQADSRTYNSAEPVFHSSGGPSVNLGSKPAQVLLADDDPVILESLVGLVREGGLRPVACCRRLPSIGALKG